MTTRCTHSFRSGSTAAKASMALYKSQQKWWAKSTVFQSMHTAVCASSKFPQTGASVSDASHFYSEH